MAEISKAQQAANAERRASARRQHIGVLRDHVTETETRLRNARRSRENGDAVLGAKVPRLEVQLLEDKRLLAEAEAAFAEVRE